MANTSYFPPASAQRPEVRAGAHLPVLITAPGPARQRRATVLVRLVLAVPHGIALSLLAVAALVVVVIGWFGALVLGRLPRFAAAFLAGYLRWYCRVGAYLLLLTDQYPPFTFQDAGYPVRLAVGAGRLNRLAVLFRIILAIPATIVALLLTYGVATIVVVIAWLVTLVSGRMPAALHQAFAAVLRYIVRYDGYLCLLTGAYPAGLFGDAPNGLAPATDASGQAAQWQQPLSSAAKRTVGLFLVLGLLTMAGGGVGIGAAVHAARVRAQQISQLNADIATHNAAVAKNNAAVTREEAASRQVGNAAQALGTAHTTLAAVLSSPATNPSNCTTVSCFNQQAQADGAAFAAFGKSLRTTAFPPGSGAVAKRLSADTAGNQKYWQETAQAASFDALVSISKVLENVGGHFDSDYSALMTSLSNAGTALTNEVTTLDSTAATLNREGAALNQRAAALNVRVSPQTATEA